MKTLKRLAYGSLVLIGAVLWLSALLLLTKTAQSSAEFGRLYELILLINAAGVVILLVLIAGNLLRLVADYRRHVGGSRLKARMVAMFVILTVLPLLLVYYFSVQFLNRGIESWFNVEVEAGLADALDLSRTALDILMGEYLERTEAMADQIGNEADLVAALSAFRRETGATEVTVFGRYGRIVATSSSRATGLVPARPSSEALMQLRQERPYVSPEPLADGGYLISAVAPVPSRSPAEETRILQSSFLVTGRLSSLADAVEQAYRRYGELVFLREPLKYSFTLTLTLVLLLSMLTAVYAAFFAARRLVAPIEQLVAGTRAVAKGDFDTRLPVPGHDEMGFLVNSFNDMTRRLAQAREQASQSRSQVESERANLEVILARLSTGVISLETDRELRTANQAASAILGVDLESRLGEPLVAADDDLLGQFLAVVERHLGAGEADWREQIVLRGEVGRRVLTCACTALPGEGENPGGFVIVFDDITALLQAQRDAAWGEVARRLAHEIKNPLTPIQLSAERMRRRYLGVMNEVDAQVLERATHTIVQQVEAMKQMVNAFSEYARAPDMDFSRFDLNRLISEVADLYRAHEHGAALALDLDRALPEVEADAGRVRQILHNLIRNAEEALEGAPDARIDIITRLRSNTDYELAEIIVEDNGPGFPPDAVEQIFDPYVTSKPKGTGLGLAIVKKLIEEHAGRIEASNRRAGGARISILLPVNEVARSAMMPGLARRHDVQRERTG
ncbi:MAG: HAMP domain-containing protein [Gammaproteobacteria bacterium]|nr:HAMP domain-containing protein [Gammaproteobacteria bacterium]